MDAFVIGLSGGSASGKTTVARKVIESLGVPWVTLLSMDSFYKVLTEEQHELAAKNEYNFDHPGKCHQRREVANEQWSGTALLLKQPFYIWCGFLNYFDVYPQHRSLLLTCLVQLLSVLLYAYY